MDIIHEAYCSYMRFTIHNNVLSFSRGLLFITEKRVAIQDTVQHSGGGGGTQIWFRRGCAAEAAKPVPIFKGHFGGKGYPLLRVFSQENCVFVYFSDEKGENI